MTTMTREAFTEASKLVEYLPAAVPVPSISVTIEGGARAYWEAADIEFIFRPNGHASDVTKDNWDSRVERLKLHYCPPPIDRYVHIMEGEVKEMRGQMSPAWVKVWMEAGSGTKRFRLVEDRE